MTGPDLMKLLLKAVLILIVSLGSCALTAAANGSGEAAAGPPSELNLAFTEEVFGGYNRDDAIAAIDIWISKITDVRNIPVSPEIEVYEDSADFMRDVLADRGDLFGVRSDIYLSIESQVQQDQIFGVVENGTLEVEYLVLTRAEDSIESLEDLQGASIILLDTARSALTSLWLDTVLMRSGLPPADRFFGRVELRPKVSRTMLPVFFGKVDACVVTRRSYEISGELNPQVERKLAPLVTSTPMVAGLVCFRDGYDAQLTADLASGLLELHEDPQGQQVLLIFGSDRIVRVAPEKLDSVRKLVEEHELLSTNWPPGSLERDVE